MAVQERLLTFALSTVCSMPNLCEKNVTASLPFPDFYFHSPRMLFSSSRTPSVIFSEGIPANPKMRLLCFSPSARSRTPFFAAASTACLPCKPGSVKRTDSEVSRRDIAAPLPNVSRSARKSKELFSAYINLIFLIFCPSFEPLLNVQSFVHFDLNQTNMLIPTHK